MLTDSLTDWLYYCTDGQTVTDGLTDWSCYHTDSQMVPDGLMHMDMDA